MLCFMGLPEVLSDRDTLQARGVQSCHKAKLNGLSPWVCAGTETGYGHQCGTPCPHESPGFGFPDSTGSRHAHPFCWHRWRPCLYGVAACPRGFGSWSCWTPKKLKPSGLAPTRLGQAHLFTVKQMHPRGLIQRNRSEDLRQPPVKPSCEMDSK